MLIKTFKRHEQKNYSIKRHSNLHNKQRTNHKTSQQESEGVSKSRSFVMCAA